MKTLFQILALPALLIVNLLCVGYALLLVFAEPRGDDALLRLGAIVFLSLWLAVLALQNIRQNFSAVNLTLALACALVAAFYVLTRQPLVELLGCLVWVLCIHGNIHALHRWRSIRRHTAMP